MKKQVITGQELIKKMSNAINLLCNTVKSTLGPSGNNIIINESTLTPFITNDGVTIAENIESEDEVENTILTIAKEASIKTNESVGDGTTTTLVLLQSIFNDGIKLIGNGYNPIKLKKEIDEQTKEVIRELEKLKQPITNEHLKEIATISANDEEIGKLISELYQKTRLIKINESLTSETTYELVNGYALETSAVSNYFFNNKKEINLTNTYILITQDEINSPMELANITNQIDQDKSLLIIAEDFSEEVINEMVLQNYQKTLNVILVKSPSYGKEKFEVLNDLSVLTTARIYNQSYGLNIQNMKINDLGFAKEVKIDKSTTTIIGGSNSDKKIETLKLNLIQELKSATDYEKELLESRIAKLTNGIGIINVGATTNTEKREKKMRFEDALCALNATQEGILVGEGITLLQVQEKLNKNIVTNALDKPFKQIIENMGEDIDKLLSQIRQENYTKLYNVTNNTLEETTNTNIIDPYLVVKNEIINASSIAGMLLTTKYLVINEKNSNLSYLKNENDPY